MQLVLVRHGETLWNCEGRVQGVSDVELSGTGVRQAEQLALSLRDFPFAAIYTSPLKRASATAQIINRFHGQAIHVSGALMEMDQGDFEGLRFEELRLREKAFLRKWIADPASVRMPRGETLGELQERAWTAISAILARRETALVVSHNFTLAAILCRFSGRPLADFRRVCVDNASKTVIWIERGQTRIEQINDRRHLEP